MTILLLNTLIFSLLLILFASLGVKGNITSIPPDPDLSHSQFRSDFAPLLPAKHPTVAGKDPNSCALCCVPNSHIYFAILI